MMTFVLTTWSGTFPSSPRTRTQPNSSSSLRKQSSDEHGGGCLMMFWTRRRDRRCVQLVLFRTYGDKLTAWGNPGQKMDHWRVWEYSDSQKTATKHIEFWSKFQLNGSNAALSTSRRSFMHEKFTRFKVHFINLRKIPSKSCLSKSSFSVNLKKLSLIWCTVKQSNMSS